MGRQINPSGRAEYKAPAQYVGRDAGGTVVDANLPKGGCVQWHPDDNGIKNRVGRPTTGQNGPVAFVDPDIDDTILATLNRQSSQTANLRDGGQLTVYTGGRVRLLVQANCTKGVTRLSPQASSFILTAFSAGTVDALETTLGAGGSWVAVAMETVDTSSAAALVECEIRRAY